MKCKIELLDNDLLADITFNKKKLEANIAYEEINIPSNIHFIKCHWCKSKALPIKPDIDAQINFIKQIIIGEYLLVDKDTLWVTPEIYEQLNIMSNVKWEII